MKRGFTLIELLVVIAIIAILAAILFPIFVSAQEQGRQTKCLNNLKQLSTSVPQYCDDYAGTMPIVLGYYVSPERRDWAGCLHNVGGSNVVCSVRDGGLWKYTRNSDVYKCPSDFNSPAAGVTNQPTNFPISYSMNARIGSVPGIAADNPYYLLSKSNLDKESSGRSSRILLFIHESRGRINDGFFSWGNAWDIPGTVHNLGTTVSYVDGHCKWGSQKQLLKEMESAQWSSNTFYVKM
ncbi:MAG: prepilin-type N-terminal cleavage/methylation domain-containing protein [Armatimonadota bacterium]